MSGPHIEIRSDLSTCEKLPAIKVNVQFPDPLKQLWSELPEIGDMPYYSTKTEVITSRMTQLRPSLSKEFESHLSIKHSLLMSLISFIGSMILHVIVVCFYHRYKHRHPTILLWCGLFCPKIPQRKAPRRASAPDDVDQYRLGPVSAPAQDHSEKVRNLSRKSSTSPLKDAMFDAIVDYQKQAPQMPDVTKNQAPTGPEVYSSTSQDIRLNWSLQTKKSFC